MAEVNVLDLAAGVNGTAQNKGRSGKPKGKAERKPRGRPRKGLRHARRLAVAVGAAGVGVLGLSVAHGTESVALLGKLPDAEVAQRTGRTRNAVTVRRNRLRIPTPRDGRRRRG